LPPTAASGDASLWIRVSLAASHSMVYVYDNTGNGIRMTYPNDVSFSFEYDNRNRLARIPGYFGSVDQPWQMGFTYDANGHLASSTSINGGEHRLHDRCPGQAEVHNCNKATAV